MSIKIYTARPYQKPSPMLVKIIPLEKEPATNVVGFLIEGGLIKPEELPEAENQVKNISNSIDTSAPVVVGGRGPHWLYAVFTHNLHYVKMLATYEPRLKKGIIVEAPSKELFGKAIDIETGEISEASLGAKGVLELRSIATDKYTLIHVQIRGDRFIEPSEMRRVEYPEINPEKPVVIEGLMPIWLGQRLVSEYVHKCPAVAVYDPRLKGAVIVASHHPDYKLGEIIPISKEELSSLLAPKNTRIIGILGDPNSGKSVFLHLLNDALRSRGYVTLTQEGDLVAPTQHWSLFSPEVRKALKKYMSPEERLRWVVESLKNAKETGALDFVLVDIGGGRPDLGERITKENLAILNNVDEVIIVSRNDAGQIQAWLDEIKTYASHLKIVAVLESRLEGEAYIDETGHGVITHLDRELYRSKKIPEDTVRVVETVVERLEKKEYVEETEYEKVSA